MSDEALLALAAHAGLSPIWTDAFGRERSVTPESLRLILAALGHPAATGPEIADSLAALDTGNALPPVIVAESRLRFRIPCRAGPFTIRLERGDEIAGVSAETEFGTTLSAPRETGYHLLETDGQECVLAVAPRRCFTLSRALAEAGKGGGCAWGISAQLYSLRRENDGGLGDVAALARLARRAGHVGADALSISPVHAQFSADLDRFSPYAPSSRVTNNVLHAGIDLSGDEARALEAGELVDWPRAGALRLEALDQEYERALKAGALGPFDAWLREQDESVELHARFEAMHRYHYRHHGKWDWRSWPDEFRDPGSPRSLAFAQSRSDEIRMHAWLQYRMDQGLAAAQAAARDAGMAVGIVSDLAVGTDAGGSHCWSRQDETLLGLSVGAPPDLLSRDGQNWGITAFSPLGLRRNGYRAFIEMLRSALRHAGGVRIDHAMGLNRIWVVPEGEPASHGAYLAMPEADLLGLVRLESERHQAIVLGEDLGTVPEGFAERLGASGIDGMRVLWFEHDEGRHRPPSHWSRHASAMTTTHDLPTVAGWWKGVDIDWNERLERGGESRDARGHARAALWQAMNESGAASGPCPGTWDTFPVVKAAVAHVASSNCELAMIPIEDLLGLEEAPNLPGTTDEHPNWRRRLPGFAEDLLDEPEVQERIAALTLARLPEPAA